MDAEISVSNLICPVGGFQDQADDMVARIIPRASPSPLFPSLNLYALQARMASSDSKMTIHFSLFDHPPDAVVYPWIFS
jgi:hypothetical protein